MLRKLLTAIAVVLCTAIALRAADNYAATQGAGKTFRCIEITGSICIPTFVLMDNTGQALGTATTPVGVNVIQGGNTAAVVTAGADDVSNTASGLLNYARLSVFDGATWDRLYGDATNGAYVNIKACASGVCGITDGGSITNISPIGGKVQTSAPAYSNAEGRPPGMTIRGGLWANLDTWAGTALGTPTNFGTTPGAVVAGSVNASMFAGTTATVSGSGTATGALRVELPTNGTGVVGLNAGTATIGNIIPVAGTAGGASNYYVQPAASDNHVVIKNGAGTFYGIQVTNNSATKNYVRFYDAGTGFNGCNSATGLLWGAEIPPTDSGIASAMAGAVGLAFSTGLSICVTSGYGSTDTTNATASAMMLNANYK